MTAPPYVIAALRRLRETSMFCRICGTPIPDSDPPLCPGCAS